MKEFGLWIDGEYRPAKSGETTQSINPATEEPWAVVAKAGEEDVNDAVAAAKRAHVAGVWRGKPNEEKAEILQNIATSLFAKQEELAAAEAQDGGGTIRKAGMADVPGTAQTFMTFSQLCREQQVEEEFEEQVPVPSRNIVRKEPIGVCAGIIPWNFPMLMAAWKIAPALAAGNTVVIKPASVTPVTALMLAEVCKEAGVPDGVVNVITGPGGVVGEALATHPDIGKVAFTGSTEVGRRIMQLASGTIKKVTLELGGKSPNIILDDADMDTAAVGACYGTFFHQGQICESGTRVLVSKKSHDDFVDKMIAAAGRITVGDPMDMTSCMGPLVSATQRNTVERYVGLGREAGANCLIGGERPDFEKGYYYKPTIFTDVSNDMRIAQEEIFGPVVSVLTYEDENEAVAIANDSMYGLGGAIWSSDTDRALALARELETGTVWINDYHMINVRFPFGGYKQSGVGRELGRWGLAEYQETKHIHVGENTPDKVYFGLLFNP
ncbi:MAG: aldehyde dehydrogenase family protein [Candidatus Binatia bacterium]